MPAMMSFPRAGRSRLSLCRARSRAGCSHLKPPRRTADACKPSGSEGISRLPPSIFRPMVRSSVRRSSSVWPLAPLNTEQIGKSQVGIAVARVELPGLVQQLLRLRKGCLGRSLGFARSREGVEESGLAHIGQTNDASFEHKRVEESGAIRCLTSRLSGGLVLSFSTEESLRKTSDMALKIRLTKVGSVHQPLYRVVRQNLLQAGILAPATAPPDIATSTS